MHYKHKQNLTLMLLLVFMMTIKAQINPYKDKSGKIGFKNEAQKIILLPKYDQCKACDDSTCILLVLKVGSAHNNFISGLHKIQLNGKVGLINSKGKEIVAPTYDSIGICGYKCIVCEDCDFDANGNTLTSASYSEDEDGFAISSLIKVYLNKKTGLVNLIGKEVVSPKYDFIFNEGTYLKVKLNDKIGIIDLSGKEIIKTNYDDITITSVVNFDNSPRLVTTLFITELNRKFGFTNLLGKEIITPSHDYIYVRYYPKIYLGVRNNNKWGIVDTMNKEVMPVNFDQLVFLKEGFFGVKQEKKWMFKDALGMPVNLNFDSTRVINANLKRIFLKGATGFYDLKNNEILSLYDELSAAENDSLFLRVQINDLYGVLDRSGNILVPIIYEETLRTAQVYEGLLDVMLKGKFGFVDKTGKIIIPLIYDDFGGWENGKARVRIGKKEFFIDKNGNELK